MNRFVTSFVATAALAFTASPLAAQTDTTFTYQGSLDDQGAAANGSFNLTFALFNALSGGAQVGSTIVMNGVPVSDGLLTAELDFGGSAFDNTSRWLEIAVNGNTLSPRQPITRSPYSIQTRGIFVDENNNVGIGTSTPASPLHVESDGGNAIFGSSNAINFETYGGRFENSSTVGAGVYGRANAFTGTSSGVRGLASSTSGRGVAGFAPAGTGTTYGGHFTTASSSGRGVYGRAANPTGTTFGVYGSNASTSGRGVYGEASASTGTTNGVYGQSQSTSGRGVYGEATASTGKTSGGYFRSNSTDGKGVLGFASATVGTTTGVNGQSASTTGRGVFGYATASIGTTYGVYGQSRSPSGRGVFGHAIASSGTTDGVFGLSDSTSGRGIDGWASASSGITFGVFGTSSSTSGAGVQGEAKATSGTNYGVIGKSFSSSGFDFYAAGAGQNYGSASSRRWKSNIEPISDPLTKLAQLRGVYYDWDDEHGGHHDLGMIAEEVGEALPEIVQYEENGVDAIGMDYSKMTPLLVEAVNALRTKQETDVTMLRSESNRRLAKKDDKINELRDSHAAEMRDLREQLANLQQIVERLASNQEKESR